MKNTIIIFVMCWVYSAASAQCTMHSMGSADSNGNAPIELIKNIAGLHHPVSTKNKEAQHYFNQGFALIYSYNDEDALRSFKRASELDPQLAMAYWGMALANQALLSAYTMSNERKKEGYEWIQKALALPSSGKERAFIEALSMKLSGNANADPLFLNTAYMNAMKKVYIRYPNDADAGVLYATAISQLKAKPDKPWVEKWNNSREFTPEGAEAAAIFKEVINKHPNHIGANHFYIHAVEGSQHPEVALPSADRIRKMKLNNPRLGHLIHMPSHIYLLMGNYEGAAKADEDVIKMKDSTLSKTVQQFVYGHSYDFMIYTYMMQGRYKEARDIGVALFDLNIPVKTQTPAQLTNKHINRNALMVRFCKWERILSRPRVKVGDNFDVLERLWASGMANVSIGKLQEADTTLNFLAASINSNLVRTSGNEHSSELITRLGGILKSSLKARMAVYNKDYPSAIESLKLAVNAEDAMPYNEPPHWKIPMREFLGAVFFITKNYVESEKIFKEELEKHPNNPRALFGLSKALGAQGQKKKAMQYENKFKEQWKYADAELTMEQLLFQ